MKIKIMGKTRKYSNNSSSSNQEGEKAIVAKHEPEILDLELPYEAMWSVHVGENVASSSGSNLRSSFIGMGFLSSLVDKVIAEKGEDDVELLLETLIAYSAIQKAKSESSDSLDNLFDDNGASSQPEVATVQPKEEPDVGVNDDKRTCLLMMNFSVNEVEFALDRLGEDAPVNEIVDFITAVQIAEKYEKEMIAISDDEEENVEVNNETLFGTMEKTLSLLEMGFSENQISSVIERFGSEVSVAELANLIFSGPISTNRVKKEKYASTTFGMGMECNVAMVKSEDFSPYVSQSRDDYVEETYRGKRPKEECFDDYPSVASQSRRGDFVEIQKGKKPKEEYYIDDSSSLINSIQHPIPSKFGGSKPLELNPHPSKSLDRRVAKPPYFFYGNVVNVSRDSWVKISQFLNGIEPEVVTTQFFSALSRKEGYIHNLPTENRYHILPKPPMTIEDAMTHTKKWWPSWDTRKQLSCISSETSGLSQLCDRLERMLVSSRGLITPEQQRDILHHCRTLNLVWIGQYKLGPVDPEYLERILGYPLNHTQTAEISLIERLQSLKHCFQTDTLGYHLSVLKPLFPGGITMLSIFSGIGGAEVAVHRLGIRFKAIISVETSETRRAILKRWWHSTGQAGELVQIEGIQKLTSKRLDSLTQKFGGFDFVVCQSPCTDSSSSKSAAGKDIISGYDYSMFYEFVRVLQLVRSRVERNK